MEYKKMPNLLDDASNQPCKFKTKNWVEINDQEEHTVLIVRSNLKLQC